MSTIININVMNKVATDPGAPIVCGNSDYSIAFTFDSEWDAQQVKTARFLYKRGDKLEFQDVVFNGRVVAVPILTDIDAVYVGVYAGELHTTTPARIVCKKSILCPDPSAHEEPAPDVYQQLLEVINNIPGVLPAVTALDAARHLEVNEDGVWAVRLPTLMYNQHTGALVKIFYGTYEAWQAWDGDKTTTMFVSNEHEALEAIKNAFESLADGTLAAKEAVHASEADRAGRATANDYNLGVFDTFAGGGDGTANVTRKTGVINIDAAASISYVTTDGEGNALEYPYFIWQGNEEAHASLLHINERNCVCNTLKYSTNLEDDNCCYIANDANGVPNCVVIRVSRYTAVDELRSYLSRFPTFIYGELEEAFRYTEIVKVGQLLNLLTSKGNWWLYEEWRKGLNLFDIDKDLNAACATKTGSFVFENTGSATTPFANIKVKRGTKYTISMRGSYTTASEDALFLAVMNGKDVAYNGSSALAIVTGLTTNMSGVKSCSFVAWADYISLLSVNTTISHLMVTEGEEVYPCEPYHGGLVREKEFNAHTAEFTKHKEALSDGSFEVKRATNASHASTASGATNARALSLSRTAISGSPDAYSVTLERGIYVVEMYRGTTSKYETDILYVHRTTEKTYSVNNKVYYEGSTHTLGLASYAVNDYLTGFVKIASVD